MELSPQSIALLAAAVGLHAVPKFIEAWKLRTNAVSRLILDTAAEVKRLRLHQESSDRRTAALIDSLREANTRIHALEQEQSGLSQQLDLWKGRARKVAADLHELYRAVSSGRTLPPKPKPEPWDE